MFSQSQPQLLVSPTHSLEEEEKDWTVSLEETEDDLSITLPTTETDKNNTVSSESSCRRRDATTPSARAYQPHSPYLTRPPSPIPPRADRPRRIETSEGLPSGRPHTGRGKQGLKTWRGWRGKKSGMA